MTTPQDRMSAAYASQPADTRHRSRLASTWRLVEQYEQLLRLQATDPARFEQVTTPTMRIALGSYELAKQAAQEETTRDDN